MGGSIQGNEVSLWAVEQVSPDAPVPVTGGYYDIDDVDSTSPVAVDAPTWTNLRRNSGDFDITKSFTQSSEVDPTRQPSFNVLTSSEIAGNIDSELSVADPALKLIVKSAFQNQYAGGIDSTISTVFTNGTASITAVGAFANAIAGQFFGVYGSTLNDRIYKIVSVADADSVIVSPSPIDETISATLSGSSIRNSNVEVGMSAQKRIPTDGGTIYKRFEGVQVGTLNVGIASSAIISLTYDMTGLDKSDSEAAIGTDNIVDASRVSGTVNDVPEFWIDGAPIDPTDTCYTDFSFALDNGISGQPAIGKDGACLLSSGAAGVTGSLVSYVDGTNPTTANSEVSKRDNETLFELSVVMKDVDSNYIVVNIPSAQYTELTQGDTANGDILKNTGTWSGNGKSAGYAVEINFITAP